MIRLLVALAFVLVGLAGWAQDAPTLDTIVRAGHDLTEKTFDDFYAAVPLRPIPGARVMYFNFELARQMGLHVGKMTPTLERSILKAFAVQTSPDPATDRVGYATRYDDGFGGLGDGRAVFLSSFRGTDGKIYDISLKGSGPTPFADPSTPQVWNRDGKMLLKHAIWETVAAKTLIANGVPSHDVLAIIQTPDGFQTFSHEAKPSPTAILVRVGPLFRPAHFKGLLGRPNVRENFIRLIDYFADRFGLPSGLSPKSKAVELLKFYAREMGVRVALWNDMWLVHGAISWGNVTLDRTTIDLTSAAFLRYPQADVTTREETFGVQRKVLREMVGELRDMFRRQGLLPDEERIEVTREFDLAYRQEYTRRKLLRMGLSEETAERLMLAYPEDTSRLAAVIAQMDQIKENGHVVHDRILDSRNLLRGFASVYFDVGLTNVQRIEKAREMLRGPPDSLEPSENLTREFIRTFETIMVRAQGLGEKASDVLARAERINVDFDALVPFKNSKVKGLADQVRDGELDSLQQAIEDVLRQHSPQATEFQRAPKFSLREEFGGTAKFAAAYLLKESVVALESGDPKRIGDAAKQMATPQFAGSMAAFTVASRVTERLIRGLGRTALPMAVGMAAADAVTGRFDPVRVATSTGSLMAAGFVVNFVADAALYATFAAAGPVGWAAGAVFTVVKLAATLYLGEKIEQGIAAIFRKR